MTESANKSNKKKRIWLTLERKLEIIKCHENGATIGKISREKHIRESSIRRIIKNAEKYKKYGKAAESSLLKSIIKIKSPIIVSMERLLSIWIEDCNQKRIPLSQNEIQDKAMSLFDAVKLEHINRGEAGTSAGETFVATSGWFNRYKKRNNYCNNRVVGQTVCVDSAAVVLFQEEFINTVRNFGYKREQVFNVDETGLLWKVSSLKDNNQNAEDRLTLLLGGNASGDLKLKPTVIYPCQNSWALEVFAQNTLPLIWRPNKDARVTKFLFEDWFSNYFCPTVKRYCSDNNLKFKILLLLDTSPSHPVGLCDKNENVRIMFLPRNTTSLIQPMDQGITAIFKAYYLRRAFNQADKYAKGRNASLETFWENYDIKRAIENVSAAWIDITADKMKAAWQNILPAHSNTMLLDSDVWQLSAEIEKIAMKIGFEFLNYARAKEYMKSQSDELNNDDLLRFDDEWAYKKEEKNEQQSNDIDTSDLENLFKSIKIATDIITEKDSNNERSYRTRKGIENSIQCYKEMYEDRLRND